MKTLNTLALSAMLCYTASYAGNRLRAEWERTEYVVISFEPATQSVDRTPDLNNYWRKSKLEFWKTALDAILAAGSKILILRSPTGLSNENDFLLDLKEMGYLDSQNRPVSGVVLDTGVVDQNQSNGTFGQRRSLESIWTRDEIGQTVYNSNGVRIQTDLRQDNSRISQFIGLTPARANFSEGYSGGFNDGGNVLSDGMGRWIADPWALDQVTHPTLAQSNAFVNEINNKLGVQNVLYSPSHIVHVDYHTKLVDEETMIVSSQYPDLKAFWEKRIASTGRNYRVFEVTETPFVENSSVNIAASSYYANSLIVNNTVLVGNASMNQRLDPLGNAIPGAILDQSAADTAAVKVYRAAFPGYKIVMLPQNLIYNSMGGSIHCLTNSIGAPNLTYLRGTIHRLGDTLSVSQGGISLSAVAHSPVGIKNLNLVWRVNSGSWINTAMTLVATDSFVVNLPATSLVESKLEYYFTAENNQGEIEKRPFVGELGPFVTELKFDGTVNVIGQSNSLQTLTKEGFSWNSAESFTWSLLDINGKSYLSGVGHKGEWISWDLTKLGRQNYILQITSPQAKSLISIPTHN